MRQLRVWTRGRLATLVFIVVAAARCAGTGSPPSTPVPVVDAQPEVTVYRQVNGRSLHAYVFRPSTRTTAKRHSAVLLFHGGGWVMGEPAWTFAAARRFAEHGMAAIPIEYRLSAGAVTPIEALSDVCAAFHWVREHADELHVDPSRVAGYGVSAGGHLVASAGTVGCPAYDGRFRSAPDLLLLLSPALDLADDRWFGETLQGRAAAADYSPLAHVRADTPPTSIVIGASDSLTPLHGQQAYCHRLTALGGECRLEIFENLGHVLTRNLANQEGDFDPDPQAREEAFQRQLRFLAAHRYITQ